MKKKLSHETERHTSRRRHHLVQQLRARPLPDLFDDSTQFGVAVVDVALGLYPQRGAHDGKEGCVEQHRAVAVQRHVHRHEPLQEPEIIVDSFRLKILVALIFHRFWKCI